MKQLLVCSMSQVIKNVSAGNIAWNIKFHRECLKDLDTKNCYYFFAMVERKNYLATQYF
jgi:hypothetical protein